MKTIIAGSRSVTLEQFAEIATKHISHKDVSEVVSGTARGADQLGEMWADIHDIPVKRFPAKWHEFGKSAGYRRNAEMAEYADVLIAIWDGESRGTTHMINLAKKAGLDVRVYKTTEYVRKDKP